MRKLFTLLIALGALSFPGKSETQIVHPNTIDSLKGIPIPSDTLQLLSGCGSEFHLTSHQFNSGAIISPQELFLGKVPGLLLAPSSGEPGGNFNMKFRGTSAFNNNGEPLILVDGIPLRSGLPGESNPLNGILPDDIESISFLKDASATSIYGYEASNGVILIETKRNHSSKPLSVNFDSWSSASYMSNKADMLNAKEFRSLVEDRFSNDPTTINRLGNANTGWQDEISQTGVGNHHNLAVSGNLAKTPFRFSLGHTTQEGVIRTSKLNRLTSSLHVNRQFFSNHLSVNLGLNASRIKNNFANPVAFQNALAVDPTQPVYEIDNNQKTYFVYRNENGIPITYFPINPLALLEQTTNESTVKRLIWNISLEYRFHFLPELKASFLAGENNAKCKQENITHPNAVWLDPNYQSGSIKKGDNTQKNNIIKVHLAFQKKLNSFISNISVLAGYCNQVKRNTFDFQELFNGEMSTHQFFRNKMSNESWFAQMQLRLQERISLGLNWRRDEESFFARKIISPSAAVAWNILNNNGDENQQSINFLKLRMSYGLFGKSNNESNRILVPERIHKTNLGLDYGIFNNRISGSFDAYIDKTKNLITTISLPSGSSFDSDFVWVNMGEIQNKGIEMSISALPILSEHLKWSVNLNATYNHNSFNEKNNGVSGAFTGPINGGIGNTIQVWKHGYPINSFFVCQQIYNNSGQPIEGLYEDRNKDGVGDTEDRYCYQKPSPDWFLGFFSDLQYKNWDFGLTCRANLGNYVYNNIDAKFGAYENLPFNVSSDVLSTNFERTQYHSNYYVQNASFFRLENLTLGYTFKELFRKPINARIYASGQNLVTFTGYEGLNPEAPNGIDFNVYPRPRTIALGVNINFN